jgi:hypothetical protein
MRRAIIEEQDGRAIIIVCGTRTASSRRKMEENQSSKSYAATYPFGRDQAATFLVLIPSKQDHRRSFFLE